jgi:hypothetical protein
MTPEELQAISEANTRWLAGKEGGKRADLCGAYLSGADLSGVNLRWACLRGADLGRADLSGADLSGADLFGAILSEADLRWANLSRASLSGAYLHGADLHGATLNWKSHNLISEILWREADTQARQMLAAFIGRRTDWDWEDWEAFQHPERDWAITVLAGWVKDGDSAPDFIQEVAKQREER